MESPFVLLGLSSSPLYVSPLAQMRQALDKL
jgi:hypothetical protein